MSNFFRLWALALVFAGALAADPVEKSGLILGTKLGFAAQMQGKNKLDADLGAGVLVGYGHYFTELVGLRSYAEYEYAGSLSKSTTLTQTHAGNFVVNADLLLDFLSFSRISLGTITGLYASAATFEITKIDKNLALNSNLKSSFGANLGTQLIIADHHHIELLGRVPFATLADPRPFSSKLRPYQITLGYSYSF